LPWSEEQFKARITARAAELDQPLRKLLAKVGLGHDTIDKLPSSGRRIDTLERIAEALQWSLAEVMGFNVLGGISIELSERAFVAAERALELLPSAARTRGNLVAAHAHLYDRLAARQRDGRPITDEIVDAYVEMLAQAWEGKTTPPAPGAP
jgi:hypothetical protein